jgi:general secretion pathway protein H
MQRARSAGFTLIELLVVMAIAAGLAALAAPGFSALASRATLDSGARALAASLRAARSQAISQHREVVFALDAQHGGGEVRFFADGSSSGARIRMAAARRARVVEVDWLTGRVAVRELLRE